MAMDKLMTQNVGMKQEGIFPQDLKGTRMRFYKSGTLKGGAFGVLMSLYAFSVEANQLADPFKKRLNQVYGAMEVISYAIVGCAFLWTLIQCILYVTQGKHAPWGRLAVIAGIAIALVSINIVKSFLGVSW